MTVTTATSGTIARDSLYAFEGAVPKLGPGVVVLPGARVIGRVTLGADVNIWFNTVLRGDVEPITIGARTNIQDNSTCHVTGGRFALVVGEDVTVGHGVTLHACTVGNRVLVGMGAVVLDGAVVGDDVMIGAGSLVPPGMKIPSGVLVLGAPAKIKRPLTEDELNALIRMPRDYVTLARRFGPAEPVNKGGAACG